MPDSTVSDNFEEKGKSQSWNKSSDLYLNVLKINVKSNKAFFFFKEEKRWKKESSDTNNITLSLNITAYENSIEAVSNQFNDKNVEDFGKEKFGTTKSIVCASTLLIQNPFEFPRQQNYTVPQPEVSQFKASQRLVIPTKVSGVGVFTEKLRSAAPSAAGALTASEFKHSFETTPPDNSPNPKALLQRLQELNNFLTDGNKDWSQKSKMLVGLRGCLIATHVPRAVDIVMENCGIWERCLIDGLKELRSSLTREYCITIAFFAVKLESRFIRQVELMFGNLMNLVQNSAKIMSSSGVILSEFIARHVHHSKLITLTSGYLVSKSSVVRRSVVHMFDGILSSWGKEILELHMNVIKEVIKSGLNDADLSCRSTSRDTYFAFSEKFPTQAQELYDSLDTIRQRALNDQQRSAASSTNSLAHEKDGLHLHSLKVGGSAATQQAFLDNRSRSDVHFRYNGTRPIARAPPTRSRNTSPTRTNPHSPHSSKMRPAVFAKPIIVPKLLPPSARLNNVAPRINTNLRALPSASNSRPPTNPQNSAPRVRPNGIPSTPLTGSVSLQNTRTNQPTVFGTARNFQMPKSAIKPPTSAIQPPKYARPNVIRTVATPTFNDQQTNDLTSSLTNLKLNSNSLTQSQHASVTDSITSNELSNGHGLSPTEHSLNDIIANLSNENVDVKRPEKLIESLKTLTELITTNQLTQQHYDEHFSALLHYCLQLLRISEASNTLKMVVLDALRVLM
uniref:CLASP N-terminal domain-containing protein n=1 Tax=Panagrolaimus davidi TaxID=227884 RepID=A0A914PXP6_9BILA